MYLDLYMALQGIELVAASFAMKFDLKELRKSRSKIRGSQQFGLPQNFALTIAATFVATIAPTLVATISATFVYRCACLMYIDL
jgi:hypothetical protein